MSYISIMLKLYVWNDKKVSEWWEHVQCWMVFLVKSILPEKQCWMCTSIFTCGKYTFFAFYAKKNSNFSIDQLAVYLLELWRLKRDIFTAWWELPLSLCNYFSSTRLPQIERMNISLYFLWITSFMRLFICLIKHSRLPLSLRSESFPGEGETSVPNWRACWGGNKSFFRIIIEDRIVLNATLEAAQSKGLRGGSKSLQRSSRGEDMCIILTHLFRII